MFFNRIPLTADGGQSVGRQEWKQDDHSRLIVQVLDRELEGDTGGSGLGRSPWRRAWQPTPVFLPGESHGQRSLVGYSPWCRKELDTTEAT